MGVAAGLYLEEYAPKNWFSDLIEINVTNLAGVPSIVYGLLALGLFVYILGLGQSILTAGLTLGLLILPIVIVSTRESIRAIPIAIREAARNLQTFDLSGCAIYCSCEPNPMSLGAIYWARLSRIYYAASREDAARAGFNDLHMYSEVAKPIAERSIPTLNLSRRAGRAPFAAWNKSSGKIRY